MSDLVKMTIEEASAALEVGKCTSVELTQACLDRIKALDSKLNAFIIILSELALAQAAESDKRRAAGESRGLLDGIPYSLKDVYATSDSPTSAASHILEDWIAPYNATVYTKLCEAGAVLLGKTNTDEFTMGVSTETSYFGVTRNPWDTGRVSGGSSGGPAAAVAANFGLFSIGTDTGGSIRQPAGFCGVVGLRPTYGRVSRWGEIAMASSLDQTGPLTRTVRDAAIVLQVLAGHDERDATSSPEAVLDYLKANF
jgi:aspartyl-tRNA(Asn)/glutamyl-tRNA(Gln) amidotransferase subunit A